MSQQRSTLIRLGVAVAGVVALVIKLRQQRAATAQQKGRKP